MGKRGPKPKLIEPFRVCTKCGIDKPLADFYWRNDRPSSSCKVCLRAYRKSHCDPEKNKRSAREWRLKYPERARESKRKTIAKNPEKYLAMKRAAYARNSERFKERIKKSKERRADKVKATQKRYYLENKKTCIEASLKWARANRARMKAIKAKRRAHELHAIPLWADFDAMDIFYIEAERLTKLTGIKHHVDHIVPLNNPLVCGLHCQFNLQILSYSENVRKGNRHWPDMPKLTVAEIYEFTGYKPKNPWTNRSPDERKKILYKTWETRRRRAGTVWDNETRKYVRIDATVAA